MTISVESALPLRLSSEQVNDIQHAVDILLQGGCREIYLFGSYVKGNWTEDSDLDLAIRGCAKGRYFDLLGKLILEIDRPIDLVDLDSSDPFVLQLEATGELYRLA